ncbi:MAG: class I tRNA ligase family protein, partial [Elusimicrobia bacterium]|nr:class I tRNA ligase family protein [Elusimicrobiota bacterium]
IIPSVEWIPAYGEARIVGMIESRPDWCLSRQRLWGTPITILYCCSCGAPLIDENVMAHIEQLIGERGTDAWFTEPAEALCPPDTRCASCQGTRFRKENDILDVWFDSGVSHYAVLTQDPRLSWPADLYLEGSDQHRGWFQTSLIPAVALQNKAPYRAVLTHGFTVDGEGKKMSKSLGNVIKPETIISTYGADMLRLWVAASDYREDIRISPEIIKLMVDVYRRIRNTVRFLLGNLHDFSPEHDTVAMNDLLSIDRWALHRLQNVIDDVRNGFDHYEFHKVWKTLNDFCAHDLSSVYFDILKDRLYTWERCGQERRSAQTVLHEIFLTLTKLIAPLLSFTAEEAWQNFKKEHDSVHMTNSVFEDNFPAADPDKCNQALAARWQRIFRVRELVTAELEKARQNGIIRGSLEASIVLTPHTQSLYTLLSDCSDMLDMVFIVSNVTVEQCEETGSDTCSVSVRSASGNKCGRCWRWQDDVNETALCGRCRRVVANDKQ